MQLNNTSGKNTPEYIYSLMEQFINGDISARKFCDLFYESFGLEMDLSLLSGNERKEFERLSEVSSRFSEFDEDRVNFPNAYSDENELLERVLSVQANLKK